MENCYKIKNAIDKEFNEEDEVTNQQIIECVRKYYTDIPEGSIQPFDYCNNHKTKDPYSGKYHIFKRLGRGRYKVLRMEEINF